MQIIGKFFFFFKYFVCRTKSSVPAEPGGGGPAWVRGEPKGPGCRGHCPRAAITTPVSWTSGSSARGRPCRRAAALTTGSPRSALASCIGKF